MPTLPKSGMMLLLRFLSIYCLQPSDRVARAQRMRQEWAERGGVPGEAKRQALRWQVREQLERNKV